MLFDEPSLNWVRRGSLFDDPRMRHKTIRKRCPVACTTGAPADSSP